MSHDDSNLNSNPSSNPTSNPVSKPSDMGRSSNDSGSEPSIQHFTLAPLEPQGDEEDMEMGEPISRQSTFLERVQSRYSFFHENLRAQRKELSMKYLKIYLVMAIGCLGVFSIYWGSMYQRETRIENLKMLVVLEDEEINGIPPLFGNQLRDLLATPTARTLGDWKIYNTSEFETIASKHNNAINEEVIRQIHHQNYWASIYVKQNSSYNIYNALANGNQYNVSDSVYCYYETGRHLTSVGPYVVASIDAIQTMWLDQNLVMRDIVRIGNITLDNANSVAVATTALAFQIIDMRPSTSGVLVAALQIGLLYLVIVSFFSFNFFVDIHRSVALMVKQRNFLLYRVFASIISYFVISLMFGLVTLAFQVDFAVTFGKSGFLVYWMVTFLTMWSVGLANELAAMLILTIYPPMVGFWLIFWVIINITPTFTPIALLPEFYRYGYAMPLHNAFEIYSVIFFNTYKGLIGRSIGIIIAWVVFLTLMAPIVVVYFGSTMSKKAAAAAAAAKKEKEKSK